MPSDEPRVIESPALSQPDFNDAAIEVGAGWTIIRDMRSLPPDGELARSVGLMREVASGGIETDGVIRFYAPRPTLALTRVESRLPGYAEACEVGAGRGYHPVLRPTGGRAVAYDESCLVIDIIRRERGPADQREYFERCGAALVVAMRRLGVDARLGGVPGEYCPGAYSINARGITKLMGTAQRAVRGARLLSAMLPLADVGTLVALLTQVNGLLTLPWDAATFGSLDQETRGVPCTAVEGAIAMAVVHQFEL